MEGEYHSISNTWYNNGNIKGTCTHVEGEEEGDELAFYINNKYESRTRYKKGKKHGKEESWYDVTSKPKYSCRYINGCKHGFEKSWYPNNQIQQSCKWNNGRKNGLEKIWDKSGKLTFQREWVASKV